ncbi:MAG: adenosylcobinamide-GDP ribazoletransferase [Actinobacteria bacterium]|nr:adenosylcobinamide-GDP ribazoletransferase [Actinomycetota bacterium]
MRNFLGALTFLTVIKVKGRFMPEEEKLSSSLVYFPLVGVVVGIIISLFFALSMYILPLILSMILTFGLEILVTGGIHIDGLADMFDGVFSGERDKNEIFRIMKKGDVGVFGLLSILFILALKIGLSYFIFLTTKSMALFLPVLVFMPAFGRWSMVYLIYRHPPARKTSLVNAFAGQNSPKILFFSTAYLAFLFILGNIILRLFVNYRWEALSSLSSNFQVFWKYLFLVLVGILVFLLIFLFVVAIGNFFTRKVGGITGDILGGLCVVTEVFYLFLSYVWLRFSC